MTEGALDLTTALHIVDAFRGRQMLVLGDAMLDRYWWGTMSRISPEAPVPVVHKLRSTLAPGGAANVAANIASLGGTPVLVGMTGTDEAARELSAALQERGINPEHLLVDPGRPTTVKTRIVAHSQHVVRVDEEDTSPINSSLAARVTDRVVSLVSSVQLLVISDYAKGLLTPKLLRQIIRHACDHGCRVIVDPKGADYSRYNGAYLLSPNRMEALTAAGLPLDQADSVPHAGARLLETLAVEAVLITQGEAGMTLFERGREPMHVPAVTRTVYDVTGAGDTAVAVMSLALAAEASLPVAAQLANLAAGLAVEQVGTVAVTADQLRQALNDGRHRSGPTVGKLDGQEGIRRGVTSVP